MECMLRAMTANNWTKNHVFMLFTDCRSVFHIQLSLTFEEWLVYLGQDQTWMMCEWKSENHVTIHFLW